LKPLLNRSELFTRQGHSPDVKFSRIFGIEAVGIVERAPSNEFAAGDMVATAMGGLGRQFDGGYAEYTCVPASQVQRFQSRPPWETLGAVPEMLQTAWGSLFKALGLEKRECLLIRGGMTSVGLAAAAIAKNAGAFVISTSRNPARADALRENGADQAIVDSGAVAEQIREISPGGVAKVLELIGTATLKDSLRCATLGGVVCMTGVVGNQWSFENFSPMDTIPSTVKLTIYAGESSDFMTTPYAELLDQLKKGTLHIKVGKVFRLQDIVEAHRCMEDNSAGGKIVVLA
jgi:NADPH:quinone reductase-like Zn-dependent oxidoreductase